MSTVPNYGHTVRIETKEGMVSKASISPVIPVSIEWLSAARAWDYIHSPSLTPPGFWFGEHSNGLRTKRHAEIHDNISDARMSVTTEFATPVASFAFAPESIINTCHRPNVSNVMVHVPDVFDIPADLRVQHAFIPTTGVAVALGYGAHVREGHCVLEMSGIPDFRPLNETEGGCKEFGGVTPLELSHAAIQLAAGSQPALDQLTLNIVELKDVPKSIRGVVDFIDFVGKTTRGKIGKKAAITAIAAAYLTYKYGISPTIDFVNEFLTSLVDQLSQARGVLDSLHLRAFDAMIREQDAKQRYLEWVANREAAQQAYLRRKELRKQARIREKEVEDAKRALFKRQREILKVLRNSTWRSMEDIKFRLEYRAAKTQQVLAALGVRRDQIRQLMDEQRSYLEATSPILWELVVKARKKKFDAWQELKEHEHLLTWMYTAPRYEGPMPFSTVRGCIFSDLYAYEQRFNSAVSQLRVAEANLRDFDVQVEEAYLTLQDEASDLKHEQEAVIYAAREESRELRRQLLDMRIQMDAIRHEMSLLYEHEQQRLSAARQKGRSKRAYREILRESLRRVRKGPTRGYSLKALYISSRRRLSGRERGDALASQVVQIPSSVTYEATVNSGQGECLGACIQRTFQEHLPELVRADLRTLHDHLVYRQWDAVSTFSACLDSVGHVVDYLYTAVQPITTAWNLVPFSFVVDWGADFSTVTKNLESMVMGAVLESKPSEAWDLHKLTPVYGDNWSGWSEPLSVEAQWIDQPDVFRREHRVRITLKGVSTSIDYWASKSCCALRYPFSLSGVGAIIPPTSLEKVFNHALEIGALVATITNK